jgi:hypothetical protein
MNIPDWSKLEFEVEGVVALSPCLAVRLHLARVEEPGILDFYERSREALGDLLAYSSTGTSWRKATSRSFALVPSWKGKMSRIRSGLQVYFSSRDEGASPARLELFVSATPYSSEDPSDLARGRKELTTAYEKYGDVSVHSSADLRVSFPVDHPLARDPMRMLSWVRGLELVRKGLFSTGNCGYSLSCDTETSGVFFETRPRLSVLFQQYPGLDLPVNAGLMRLFRYDGQTVIHKAIRVNWLTLLSGNCVEQLGGMNELRGALGSGPATLHELGDGAALLQAGPEPKLGDLSQRDFLPSYRQVARAIRPVRIDTLERTPYGSYDDWVQDWLDAFDHEPA